MPLCKCTNCLRTTTPIIFCGDELQIRVKRSFGGYRMKLCIPRHGKEFLENSFHVTSFYLWNSQPPQLWDCTSIHAFKSSVYAHFFLCDNNETTYFPKNRTNSTYMMYLKIITDIFTYFSHLSFTEIFFMLAQSFELAYLIHLNHLINPIMSQLIFN